MRPALERLRQEHAALTAVHGDMQERADKCVKRLLAVHAAFEEVHEPSSCLGPYLCPYLGPYLAVHAAFEEVLATTQL